jgi:hypothetical protein
MKVQLAVFLITYSESDAEMKIDRLNAESITAPPGTRVSLPCRVAYLTNIQWRNEEAIIFNYGYIQRNFTDRFALGNTENFHHALVITNTKESDSGFYECIDNNGRERSYFVFLTVAGTLLLKWIIVIIHNRAVYFQLAECISVEI